MSEQRKTSGGYFERRSGLDVISGVDNEVLKRIKETLINPQASYIENVSLIIEHEIKNALKPTPEDFETDHEYQVAAARWDARIAALLVEAAELQGRMLALEELLAELEAVSTAVSENQR